MIKILFAMHHLDLAEQRDSAQWRYYSKLFQVHTPELVDIVSSHPPILWKL